MNDISPVRIGRHSRYNCEIHRNSHFKSTTPPTTTTKNMFTMAKTKKTLVYNPYHKRMNKAKINVDKGSSMGQKSTRMAMQ